MAKRTELIVIVETNSGELRKYRTEATWDQDCIPPELSVDLDYDSDVPQSEYDVKYYECYLDDIVWANEYVTLKPDEDDIRFVGYEECDVDDEEIEEALTYTLVLAEPLVRDGWAMAFDNDSQGQEDEEYDEVKADRQQELFSIWDCVAHDELVERLQCYFKNANIVIEPESEWHRINLRGETAFFLHEQCGQDLDYFGCYESAAFVADEAVRAENETNAPVAEGPK